MTFAGHKAEPIDPGNRASKAFDKVADDLYVNEKVICTHCFHMKSVYTYHKLSLLRCSMHFLEMF